MFSIKSYLNNVVPKREKNLSHITPFSSPLKPSIRKGFRKGDFLKWIQRMSLIGQRRYGGTIDWMFIYSQCWDLTPDMTVFVGGPFWRLLGPGGGVLMNEISAFTNEMPERYLSSSTMWRHSKNTVICEPEIY